MFVQKVYKLNMEVKMIAYVQVLKFWMSSCYYSNYHKK